MKALTKAQRAIVRAKYDGHCAYCGVTLPERWHVDHLEAVQRMDWIGGPALKPENHRMDNFMPACVPCNLSKGPMPLEEWRKWIAGHVNSLNAHHSIYRTVKSFGLVIETGASVNFYFEQEPQP